MRLFNEGRLTNVANVLVEPVDGRVTRIEYSDGSFRITYGNDLGLNPGAAEDLAKDKGHTKFMLRSIGVVCPRGEEFLLPWWSESIKALQEQPGELASKTTDQADEYVQKSIGYPVYVKPVSGSKGDDVYRVDTAEEMANIFRLYEEKGVKVAVVEEAVFMPDYRVVILDGKLISAYKRIPLAVIGNGIDTTKTLIHKLQTHYLSEGRKTQLNNQNQRIIQHLGKADLDVDYIPSDGEELLLSSISNLSAGGTSLDVTKTISPRWVELAAKITKSFNLRLCGVDMACTDIESQHSEYSVLEINAEPGLDHYASSGEAQKRIVDDLYTAVLNAPLALSRM